MSDYVYIFYALIGILAGFIGGLMGVGGGIVVVPALLFIFYLLDYPAAHAMQVAVGTSLAAMVFTAASSAYAHFKKKGIYWNLAAILAPGIIVGAILGSLIADALSSEVLTICFGVFLILVGLQFFISKQIKESEHKNPHLVTIGVMGFIIGALSSIFGIGGGIITVPFLTAFHTPMKNAISTSAFTGFLIAFFGAISFLYLGLKHKTFSGNLGYINIPAFICISMTSIFSAPLGAKVAYALPTEILKRIFGFVLILIGVDLIYNKVFGF